MYLVAEVRGVELAVLTAADWQRLAVNGDTHQLEGFRRCFGQTIEPPQPGLRSGDAGSRVVEGGV